MWAVWVREGFLEEGTFYVFICIYSVVAYSVPGTVLARGQSCEDVTLSACFLETYSVCVCDRDTQRERECKRENKQTNKQR